MRAKNQIKAGSYLLICRDQGPDVVALRILVDELDVANQQLARRLGLLEAVLYTFIGRDRLLFSIDELECVDEATRHSVPASENPLTSTSRAYTEPPPRTYACAACAPAPTAVMIFGFSCRRADPERIKLSNPCHNGEASGRLTSSKLNLGLLTFAPLVARARSASLRLAFSSFSCAARSSAASRARRSAALRSARSAASRS